MRLGGRLPAGTAPDDVATALELAAAALGMRPALVVLSAEGRSEQGVASLANWAAKIANLLVEEGGLGIGDRLGLDAPPGWTTASACLAAWWLGVVIVPAATADVVVRHVLRPSAPHARLELVVGDAFDGTATGEDPERALTWCAQPFPDRPPAPARNGGLDAIEVGGRMLPQARLLEAARTDGRDALGLLARRDDDGAARGLGAFGAALVATALRPLLTAAPTVVVLDGAGAPARGEGVERWLRTEDLPPLC